MEAILEYNNHYNHAYFEIKENEVVEVVFHKNKDIYSIKLIGKYGKISHSIFPLVNYNSVVKMTEALISDRLGREVSIDLEKIKENIIDPEDVPDYTEYLRLKKKLSKEG